MTTMTEHTDIFKTGFSVWICHKLLFVYYKYKEMLNYDLKTHHSHSDQ